MSTSSLLISGIELYVYLGWTDLEQQVQQIVTLDIDICFAEAPKACQTDSLEDTFCYAFLIEEIKSTITPRPFRLIEHLTHELYQLIRARLPDQSTIRLHLTKRPKIPGFTGQVCFRYGDE